MSIGDSAPLDDFDLFLQSASTESVARQEYQRRLLELTPTVNDTLRALGIPLLQNTSEEEINANFAVLFLHILENEQILRAPEEALLVAKLKINRLFERQALTILDIKNLIIEVTDNPSEADARKHNALARRLYNQEFDIGDTWFQAYDLLIPGASFDGNSESAQAGYLEAEQDAYRREERRKLYDTFKDALSQLVQHATEDSELARSVISEVSTQAFVYRLYPANSEAAIDEILRAADLQTLKPFIKLFLEDLADPNL